MAEIGLPPAAVVTAVSPPTRALMLALALLPAHFVPAADRVRAAVRRSLASVFADVDVIAWPTTPTTAPPLDNTTVQMASGPAPADVVNIRHAVLANLCGTPGINIPVGLDSSGLPIGLQLLAPWGAEALLLDAAEQVERATDRAHVDLVPPIAR
jgi:Asp-tRNA(Asn)/Glu-tRNA(Gln) amidotransferase A subunit family amidase